MRTQIHSGILRSLLTASYEDLHLLILMHAPLPSSLVMSSLSRERKFAMSCSNEWGESVEHAGGWQRTEDETLLKKY
jgi:hypothetical protein